MFSSSAGLTGVDDFLTGSFVTTDFTGKGELKLKLGGLVALTEAAAEGLTVMIGAEKVNVGLSEIAAGFTVLTSA